MLVQPPPVGCTLTWPCKLTWVNEGELVTLVAILDRSRNKNNFITTLFLTQNGQVLEGNWSGEPFIMVDSQPCVEPVDTHNEHHNH